MKKFADNKLLTHAFAAQDNKWYWRVTDRLKTNELKPGQEIMLESKLEDRALIVTVVGFSAAISSPDISDFTSLQELYKLHKVSSVKELCITKPGSYYPIQARMATLDAATNKHHIYAMSVTGLPVWKDINGIYILHGVERL